MNTYMKIALVKEQFLAKIKIEGFDGYEIQLLGKGKDDFSLIKKINRPVATVHYPMDMCGLSVMCEEDNFEYMEKCFEVCRELSTGLVIHADVTLDDLMKKSGFHNLCYTLSKQNISIHIENSSYTNSNEAVKICNYMNELTFLHFAYPLLDTGHSLIAAQKSSLREENIFVLIKKFASKNYKVHFSDIVGSGLVETGGVHGNNFSMNEPFMKELLNEFDELYFKPSLIIEVEEEDYCNPANAIELNNKIKEYLKTKRSFN